MPSLSFERRKVSEIVDSYPRINRLTDMGSGWGGLVRAIAKNHPGLEIEAVERSRIPHIFSKTFSFLRNYHSIRDNCENIFNIKLNNNEAYIAYLSGPMMKKLRQSFERDQPVGGVLISIAFSMPGWTATRIEHADGPLKTALYIYEF